MAETINKKALAETLATKLDISKKDATEVVELVLDEMKAVLEEGNTLDLAGFGKFEVRERAARDGFNPQTKEKIKIPATKAVGFKPAKALKEAVK